MSDVFHFGANDLGAATNTDPRSRDKTITGGKGANLAEMAGIGLPGTLSFVADDLIVSGSLDEQLHAGLLVIIATVLAGIAMMRGWFHVFGGPVDPNGARHAILPRERVALTVLLATLFLLGLWPGPLVRALDRATGRLLGVPVESTGEHSVDGAASSEDLQLFSPER